MRIVSTLCTIALAASSVAQGPVDFPSLLDWWNIDPQDPVMHAPTLATYHLQGPVAQVTGYVADLAGRVEQIYVASFDRSGRLTRTTGKTYQFQLGNYSDESTADFAYDAKGRLTRVGVGPQHLSRFEYSSQGQIVRTENKRSDNYTTYKLAYDKDQRPLLLTEEGPGGKSSTLGEWSYEKDARGRTVEHAKLVYDESHGDVGRLHHESRTRILGGKVLTSIDWSYIPGNLERIEYAYERDGQWHTTRFDAEGKRSKTEWFDRTNRRVRSLEESDGDQARIEWLWSYDKKGKEISSVMKEADIVRFAQLYYYQHDSHGNWIRRTEVDISASRWPFQFGETQRREIAYYP